MPKAMNLLDESTASLERLASATQVPAVREAVDRAKRSLGQIRDAVAQHDANTVVDLCSYDGMDSTAEISNRVDEGGNVYAYSRCHCGVVTCERGTPDEAAQALDAHRHPTTGTPEVGGR